VNTEEESSGNRARVLAGAVGAPLVFAALWIAPIPVSAEAHHLAAIFGAVLVLWVSEALPIPVTALLVAPLLVICGVAEPKEAFKHYADPLLFLFVGGFFMAESMQRHGLDVRIARAIVRLPGVRSIPSRVRIALLIASSLVSMWISNTASAAIFLPIVLGTLGRKSEKLDKNATGSLLGLALATSLGGMGTLVGSPPNLITARFLAATGVRFGFVEWFAIGFPVAIVTTLAAIVVLKWMFPAPARSAEPTIDATAGYRGSTSEKEAPSPGPWKRGEIVTAFAFGLAILGWTLPGVCTALGLSFAGALEDMLEPGAVAIVASAILFAAPDGKGERVLRWRDATTIDWGTILLFGGGIALGTHMISTGLAGEISEAFVAVSDIRGLWTFTAACCVFATIFTEVASNTATASLLVPLVIGIANEIDVPVGPPVLAAGLCASCGFMLPMATGPNAIVYGTGRITQAQMIRAGFVLDVVCTVIIFALLRVLCPLYGWS
jgi:sodium-dependent dicarboxylate transporter 2/3/5